MSANEVDFGSNLTFVSTTGPTLDNASARIIRAHITRANFARRRQRLVREYTDQRDHAVRLESLQAKGDGQATDRDRLVDIQLPSSSLLGLEQNLNRNDAFFINHCG